MQGGSEAGSGMVQLESDHGVRLQFSRWCDEEMREDSSQLDFLLEETLEWGEKIVHTKRERNGVAHEHAQLAR